MLRYSAFTDDPGGGNPAGIVLDASGLDDARMLDIAREVGYSETAFLVGRGGGDYDVRYFSPQAEVPFCGHATIASAVALAERDGVGELVFHVPAGDVPVRTQRDDDGAIVASLTSVAPRVHDVDDADVAEALAALRWRDDELDTALPPRIAYAGARHLILAAATRERLENLDYDVDRLTALMRARDLTTVDLVWRERDDLYHARNPFPVGGVYEDPATGAAAAAIGAYLRALRLVEPPARVTVLQGEDMGRPSRILVGVPGGDGPITVSGHAVPIGPPEGQSR
jgi:PhzF family phenazine biosynthesis protein